MTTELTQSPDAEKAAADKLAADKVVADTAAVDKAAADKVVADKAAADKVVADKAASDKVVADKAAADKVIADKAAAPAEYKFVAPEGTVLDATVAGALGEVAKELNLSQENAQKVVDKMSPVLKARAEAASVELKSTLLAAAQADKEIGGEKFQPAVEAAKLAITAHFAPEFKKFLDDSGLGNHPEMIRGLAKIGVKLKQDGFVPGDKDTEKAGDARSLYPNSNMQA